MTSDHSAPGIKEPERSAAVCLNTRHARSVTVLVMTHQWLEAAEQSRAEVAAAMGLADLHHRVTTRQRLMAEHINT